MLSWHAPSCARPKVVLGKDKAPTCRSCHQTFTAYSGDSKLWSPARLGLPELDIPHGQSRLRWPESVRYYSSVELQLPPQPPSETEKYSDLICCDSDSRSTEAKQPETFSQGAQKVLTATSTHPALVSGNCIRVLKLSPGHYSDPIHGVLEVVNLDKAPRYDALSYTWADENGNCALSRGVFLGPEWLYFPITINCSAALRRLRHRRLKARRVWIDSICIDQRNVQERSHQVGLMSIIYSTAHSVTMYVGEHKCGSDENGQRFMTLVREADEGYGIATEASGCDRRSVSQFFKRPYFSRLWIIQEVALSRSAYIYCGPDVIPWSKFQPERLKTAGVEEYQVPSWIGLTSLPRAHRSWGIKDLPRILFATSQCKSSDPRDRIFALLGLFGYNSNSRTYLKPDYSISTRETFIGTAAFLLYDMGLAYLLKLSNIRPREEIEDLPSWVPTWTQKLSDLSCIQPSEKLSEQLGLQQYFWSRHPGSLVATLAPHLYTSRSSSDMDLDFYGVDEESGALVVIGIEVLNGSMLNTCSGISSKSGVNFHYYRLPEIEHKIAVLPRYDQNKQGKYHWYPDLPEDRLLPRDRVVAIRGCDELLHLRPKHDFFEIIGTCVMVMIAPSGYDISSKGDAYKGTFTAEDMSFTWMLEYLMFSSNMVATSASKDGYFQDEREVWAWCLECNEALNYCLENQGSNYCRQYLEATEKVTSYLTRWEDDKTLLWRNGHGQSAWVEVSQLYDEWLHLWQLLFTHAEACGLSIEREDLASRAHGPTLRLAPPELLTHSLGQRKRKDWNYVFFGKTPPDFEPLACTLMHWKRATVNLVEKLNHVFPTLDVGVTFNGARIPLTPVTAKETTEALDWKEVHSGPAGQTHVELHLGDWSEIEIFIQVLKDGLSAAELRVQRLFEATRRDIVKDILFKDKQPRRYVLI